jgi:NAD-reducing hydrogenase small subunit
MASLINSEGARVKRNDKRKIRLATAWLGGCSGCHMSFLDLDERLLDLEASAKLVYSPFADIKELPKGVDVIFVEGAVANIDHLRLAQQIREQSRIVISFGDCAVTGNVTSLRNRLAVNELLTYVYEERLEQVARGSDVGSVLPPLMPKVLPLHQVIPVDLFMPGCPPEPDRIWTALDALFRREPVILTEEMRRFG